ncbi:calcium/sodium antiporter [Alkalibacter mobilis]|uniref:calcium/sodium antiporter n=1 Tax=Alkalibacter mobilis TaxID=2787712 RepID=UPI00189C7DD7|nr:calcium/sodium antiporter [Alkalibacter mobilis]MBF7096374.1 calcium/sodium antiporter [Alkalibacter mobilis]
MEELLFSYLTVLPTLVLVLIIGVSLVTLSKGADVLVDQAVDLSIRWGVPKMIIGATIVSLGTTLPEVSVSVLAAIEGNADMALGNAIGSIIADTGLIIGLAAIIGTLPVDQLVVERQGKIQVAAGLLLAVVSLPFLSPGPGGNISRIAGIIFLILLAIYVYVSIKWSRITDFIETDEDSSDDNGNGNGNIVLQIVKIFAAITLVIVSSKILIQSVEITAIRVGIPQSVIAATLIAFGTSLPELITAVNAVRKGHGELAVGNIVGADILNVLFVVGSAAAVTAGGLNVPTNYYKLQIPTMIIILLAFRFFTMKKGDTITKKEGLFLMGIYFVYLALNYLWI